MKKLAFILSLFLPPQAAIAAEAWDCQFPGHAGVWQVDGNDLVAPASSSSSRFPIIRNTADAIVAVTDEFAGRRFEMVVFDRRKMSIRILLIGLDANAEQREMGNCVVPDTHAAVVARAAIGDVRRRVRDLVDQARGLTDRGYTTAANLKLTEAAGFEKVTPDEAS